MNKYADGIYEGRFRGLDEYGFNHDLSWYKLDQTGFDYRVSLFPQMNWSCIFCGLNSIMPDITSNDYTIDTTVMTRIDNWISWCKARGIKLAYRNGWRPSDIWTNSETRKVQIGNGLKTLANYWQDEEAIIAFDIVNEPWNGGEGTTEIWKPMAEYIIDTFREAINADRITAIVESHLEHMDGMGWVRTNPIDRDSVAYEAHLYSNNWTTGAWYTWEDYTPWGSDYSNSNYEAARRKLIDGAGNGLGLYDRWGFIRKELDIPVFINETAFLTTEQGLRYGYDVYELLREWKINFAYHNWYSSAQNGTYRPMVIHTPDTYPDYPRAMSTVIKRFTRDTGLLSFEPSQRMVHA